MSERFNVLMCKFYTRAVVGIIIEYHENMHGVTTKIFFTCCEIRRTVAIYVSSLLYAAKDSGLEQRPC